MTASQSLTPESIRHTINSAGTILISDRGQVYFDLNSKSTAEIDQLRTVLRLLADVSGATVEEGIPHPLTRSAGTMLLRLNISPNAPVGALNVKRGIFASGNCYCYAGTDGPRELFSHYATDTDDATKVRLAAGCRLIVPGSNPGSWQASATRTLLEDVKHAVALNAQMPNSLAFDAYVPTTLYDRDPVKAITVEVHMRSLTASHGDTYNKSWMAVSGQNHPIMVHHVHGFGSCNELEKRKNNSSIAFLDDVRQAIETDVVRHSSAHNIQVQENRRPQVGSILEALNIVSVDIDEVAGAPATPAFR